MNAYSDPTVESRYTTQVLSTLTELMPKTEAWENCRQQQERPLIEQHHHWLTMNGVAQKPNGFHVILLYDQEEVVGIAPVVIKPKWKQHWRFRYPGGSKIVLSFPMDVAELCGYSLMAPETLEAQGCLWNALLSACRAYPIIRLNNVPMESPVYLLLTTSRSQRRGRWLWLARGIETRWLVRIAPTFEEYLKKFDGKRRYKLRREVGVLEEKTEDTLTLTCITTQEAIPHFLAQVEQVMLHSWQGKKDLVGVEKNLRQLAERGWMRCYLLSACDQPLAFLIGWQGDGIFYADKTGYDQRWAKYCPGKVMWYKILADLHAAGNFRWMDFGPTDIEYKQFWATDSYRETSVYLIRPRLYTALAFIVPVFSRGVLTTITRIMEHFGLRARFTRFLHRLAKGQKKPSGTKRVSKL